MEAKLIEEKGNSFSLLLKGTNDLSGILAFTDFENEYTIGKLCLKNCLEIKKGYDLDKLVEEEFSKFDQDVRIIHRRQLKESLTNMFQKALELIKDKEFSKEDMHKALHLMRNKPRVPIIGEALDIIAKIENQRNEIIKSLQQTEWEVEIVMEQVCNEVDEASQPLYHEQPKLDKNGCLILNLKLKT